MIGRPMPSQKHWRGLPEPVAELHLAAAQAETDSLPPAPVSALDLNDAGEMPAFLRRARA